MGSGSGHSSASLHQDQISGGKQLAKTSISLTTSYSVEHHMFANKMAKNKKGNCSAFALMGKADAAWRSTNHNFIRNLPTTPSFMAHPAVRYWQAAALTSSMSLMLVFMVPHTGNALWKTVWKM